MCSFDTEWQHHGQQEESVQRSEKDDQEDHLEERDKHVAGCEHESQDADHGWGSTLQDGQAQQEQAIVQSIFHGTRGTGYGEVMGNVGGKVHGEANAHDEVDHGDGVQRHPPQGHEAQHPQLDGHDGEGDPQGANQPRDEEERDQNHDGGGDEHALHRRRHHL